MSSNAHPISVWFLAPPGTKRLSPAVAVLNGLAVLVLLAGGLALCFHAITYSWNWPAMWNSRGQFLQGWLTTVGLSIASLVASLVIGLLTATARRGRLILLRYLGTLYVEFIRGTPLLVQILILFYVIANAMRIENRYLVGALALSIFHGAYISEIIRAGIESVGQSQLEAARAVGFDRWQIYRFVIGPLAFRQMLPPLAGEFASLIKDSSLLSIIAVNEFTLAAQQVNSRTYSSFEGYFPLAFGYLVLTLPIFMLVRRLEERSRYET
ncbi:MAG TPA: amino acid ABC transporter permease [Chthoniobacteraceae bacterium]|jgi:polar amino acid transport system permease protein|nr:amino acid ABC transporter permease [Chthoniobacteraceae bacterium]